MINCKIRRRQPKTISLLLSRIERSQLFRRRLYLKNLMSLLSLILDLETIKRIPARFQLIGLFSWNSGLRRIWFLILKAFYRCRSTYNFCELDGDFISMTEYFDIAILNLSCILNNAILQSLNPWASAAILWQREYMYFENH